MKKLKTFDSNYFRGKNHFEEDGTQNDLVFQPMYRYFKRISSIGTGNYIYFLKYKGLSDENVTAPNTSDYSLNSQLSYLGTKTRVGFKGSCLKQDKITYVHGKVVNIYIAYEINENLNISSYWTLKNCLFGAVCLTKNVDTDKYKYSGYGIGFDTHEYFLQPSGGPGRNVIIFRVYMSSYAKIDNWKKKILILCKGPTQGLEQILSAEKMYAINFTENDKTFCFSLHYNGANS